MEFGLSMAIAQQMIFTMNHCISTMAVPGVTTNTPVPQISYYAAINNKQVGPLTEDELKDHINAGVIGRQTLIWHLGLTGWTAAGNIAVASKYFK